MIYITCPAHFFTGGPTLAHQLCRALTDLGYEASMFYISTGKKNRLSPVHPGYVHYGNKFVTKLNVESTDTIVFLETYTKLVAKYKNAKKMIWWMSVDNYFVSNLSFFKRILRKIKLYEFDVNSEIVCQRKKLSTLLKEKNIIHLVQSEYARLFLLNNNVKKDSIFSLTDYIEDELLENAKQNNNHERKNVVLYNPKKGLNYTKRIIDAAYKIREDIDFVPVVNKTKKQVSELLCSSKVYIDFGNHPGKDRFPREAVASGCCLLVGKRGSACNSTDIQIPKACKMDVSLKTIPQIVDKIIKMIDFYDDEIKQFEAYKAKIYSEKELFLKEIKVIFKK